MVSLYTYLCGSGNCCIVHLLILLLDATEDFSRSRTFEMSHFLVATFRLSDKVPLAKFLVCEFIHHCVFRMNPGVSYITQQSVVIMSLSSYEKNLHVPNKVLLIFILRIFIFSQRCVTSENYALRNQCYIVFIKHESV